MAAGTSHLLSAAIDFGTTFSGYAFSTKNDFLSNPQNVSSFTWSAGSGCLQSLKTSTCVLFDPKGNFHSFGFEAEDKYCDLAYDNLHKDWYYFRRFKMVLYHQKELNRKFHIKSLDGKTMPAMKVFSSAICYLKKHLLNTSQMRGADVQMSDIAWVLTVPAIWSDPAKQFMREAAVEAGIPNNQLQLSLEPEAASLYCKHLQVLLSGDNLTVFRNGSKYMVLDAGGGTIDITVHEVKPGGTLRELYKANGGDWGGTKVDEEFERLLSDILGQKTFDAFQKECVPDLLEMHRSFEVKKRSIKATGDDKVTFSVPVNLLETFKRFNPGVVISNVIANNSKYSGDVTWSGDKLRISANLARRLFKSSLDSICGQVQMLLGLPELSGVTAILMLGGYSECPLLQNAIKITCPNLRLIVPRDAGLVVLNGAVINGHTPSTISERVCKFTYGARCRRKFIEGFHKEEYKTTSIRGVRCNNVFEVHARMGDSIHIGQACKPSKHVVVSENQKRMQIGIYASNKSEPLYVTDPGCQKLGDIVIDMPDTTNGIKRGNNVSMTFGGTEIEVNAVDIDTGKKHRAFFNFLG
ncbi:heat shock 70 kDa protein 12B-like [Ylistrum balloti]|uniref:heat shock 70 kDa protein 12B-like n=1 Tax=Ylistrum balloti TaxID=509963 RepID=UPI002905F796|nr:heat shock 70 kDa protein 12B-like [Ylistrum balloti]